MKWYERPMRIAALQHSSGDNLDDSLTVLDIWKQSDFNVDQLKHLFTEGYGYIDHYIDQLHGEKMRAYLDKAHRLGIKVIVYVNTHLLLPSMEEKKTEWACRTSDGGYAKGYNEIYYFACPNSPWAEWLLDTVKKLAKYEIDGIFSDGPGRISCSCQHCRRKFEKENGYPFPEQPVPGSKEEKALRAFHTTTPVEFSRRLYQTLKKAHPDAICYQNLDIFNLQIDRYLTWNDLVGSEGGFMFYGPPSSGFLWKPSLTAKLLEACAEGKPTVIFAAGDQKSWSHYLHAPAETRLMFAGSVSNGASVWYGIHTPISAMGLPGGKAATDINHFLAKQEHWFSDTVSLSSVGILHSISTRENLHTTTEKSDFYGSSSGKIQKVGDVAQSLEGFASMLYRFQIPFDLLTEQSCIEGIPDRFSTIILPTCVCLSDEVVGALREFVKKGGLLIASGDSSLLDENGNTRDDFGLSDVFGVSAGKEIYTFQDWNYFVITSKDHPVMRDIDIHLVAAPDFGREVICQTAKPLAHFHAPMAGRYVKMSELSTPAVTWNTFGKGHCLCLPGTFGEMYKAYSIIEYPRMISSAINIAGSSAMTVKNAPPSLEVSLRGKKDGSAVMVHLINYTGGMTRPIQKVIPVLNLKICLSRQIFSKVPTCVRTLAGEREIPFQVDDADIHFSVSVVSEYEVVVIN